MKKKKISLKNLIYDNRFVLALSIIAAVIIWIVVAIQASPEDDRIIKDVPVKIEISNNVSNLGLQMFGNTDFTVEVKVHGKRYEVAESVLTKDDISVVAKTNYVDSTGSQTLKLEVTAKDPSKANYEIVSLSQDSINVYFDYYKEGEYTLQPDVVYDGASYVTNGLIAETPVLSANTVKLSGPVTEMAKIKKVVARVTLNKKISATTTLDAEIIRELLPGEGNVEFVCSEPLRLGGEIGHQLCPRCALAHVRELFAEAQVFFGEFAEQIADDAAVPGAGGRAHGQHAFDVQKQHSRGCFRRDAHLQHRTGCAGIGGGEGLSRPCLGQNIAVAPDVLLLDQNAPGQHQTDRFRRIAGTQQQRILRETRCFRAKTGEHGRKLLFGNTGEERGRPDHG